ncbi:hypothetical protein ACGFWI_37920 [Streptomyces sp. NPDC048434]|uniref:hypothetical protein n=1 Tax=Streptomyces sp. NPDC048434 TaxID=3365549 RepID=UPI003714EE5E
MSSLALLVLLLLILVGTLFTAGLAYVSHRHPTWATPLLVAIAGAALVVASVTAIVTR